ncbi:unnamed protein product [Bursaphelenchus xylophilus]|uniref:(pine wood nematode) hypothetical protein n=1 Tax=Bursaphelenchus xylophilus TaxID=6326 RepID=A0A1I7RZI2_BURXY|nr:unnamed protein product [Bursaphelenchus xylophilus]CAG9111251.1 unnamed protein product [Bursaphelenchus xylophilus]
MLTILATLIVATFSAPSHRFLELESDHPANRRFEIEEGSQWRHASVQDPWIKFFTQRALETIEREENDGIRLLNVQLIDSIVAPTDNGLHYKLRFVVGKTNCLTSDLICDYLNVVSRKVYEADITYDYGTRQEEVSVWPEGDEIF